MGKGRNLGRIFYRKNDRENLKHLLPSLALILSANAWANDEFPIELTCEVGAETIFFYLNETKDGSWFMLDKFNKGEIGLRRFVGEKFPLKRRYEIEEHYIELNIGTNTFNEIPYLINRYSLGVTKPSGHGQCYKGFKEYEKQI